MDAVRNANGHQRNLLSFDGFVSPIVLEELRFKIGLEEVIIPSFSTAEGQFLLWTLRQDTGENDIPAFLMQWTPSFLKKWLRAHPHVTVSGL